MATTRLTITYASDKSAADVAQLLSSGPDSRNAVLALANYLRAGATGVRGIKVEVEQSPAAASQTITCDQASAVAATDEVTIGGISCASVAADPTVTDGEWLLGADDDAMATNLAAAINGHSTLGLIVSATAASAVVTVTARVPGTLGNLVELSETGNGLTLGAAAMAGGDGGEAADTTTYNLGVA